MGRPAENIEYYGGFPALYVTDLVRWKIKASQAALSFISGGMRPYLLLDLPASAAEREERVRIMRDLEAAGFVTERVAAIPPPRKMEYFVAAPRPRPVDSELFRISHPKWEALLQREIPSLR
jgi:hypothetical protein